MLIYFRIHVLSICDRGIDKDLWNFAAILLLKLHNDYTNNRGGFNPRKMQNGLNFLNDGKNSVKGIQRHCCNPAKRILNIRILLKEITRITAIVQGLGR